MPKRPYSWGEDKRRLTTDQVQDIRRRYAEKDGPTMPELAEEYGLNYTTIRHIINRSTYKDVE